LCLAARMVRVLLSPHYYVVNLLFRISLRGYYSNKKVIGFME